MYYGRNFQNDNTYKKTAQKRRYREARGDEVIYLT